MSDELEQVPDSVDTIEAPPEEITDAPPLTDLTEG